MESRPTRKLNFNKQNSIMILLHLPGEDVVVSICFASRSKRKIPNWREAILKTDECIYDRPVGDKDVRVVMRQPIARERKKSRESI